MTKAPKHKAIILTARQQECAEYMLQGKSAREIAEILGLSRRTVEYYLDNMKSKLECKNKIALALKLTDVVSG